MTFERIFAMKNKNFLCFKKGKKNVFCNKLWKCTQKGEEWRANMSCWFFVIQKKFLFNRYCLYTISKMKENYSGFSIGKKRFLIDVVLCWRGCDVRDQKVPILEWFKIESRCEEMKLCALNSDLVSVLFKSALVCYLIKKEIHISRLQKTLRVEPEIF